ncbi:hypothetical protein F4808DRAFT_290045 [Astrocystis sublimbata]|nr:hypothetical protein F4808DRAFT_290045 [Astrocystis sublimbata]
MLNILLPVVGLFHLPPARPTLPTALWLYNRYQSLYFTSREDGFITQHHCHPILGADDALISVAWSNSSVVMSTPAPRKPWMSPTIRSPRVQTHIANLSEPSNQPSNQP